ncbi:MAG: WecB/TagA/CpsF family glycosyltransferase, partial [Planctomycetes bacterium]|nr:WecB/TagA/CpsF family glycosyltransferase [Planctomycetota bacterium]
GHVVVAGPPQHVWAVVARAFGLADPAPPEADVPAKARLRHAAVERWMAAQHQALPAVLLGVGAWFDFASGAKREAPGWMRRVGLEWLFRLCQEPRRLAWRYLWHNPRFCLLVLLSLLRRRG